MKTLALSLLCISIAAPPASAESAIPFDNIEMVLNVSSDPINSQELFKGSGVTLRVRMEKGQDKPTCTVVASCNDPYHYNKSEQRRIFRHRKYFGDREAY